MEPVYLRALELEDLERTWKWHNDPELYETLQGTFHHVSRATEEDWLRKKVVYSPQELNLAICLRSNSEHIGNIYVRNIDWVARHGEVGIFLGEVGQRSRGYGPAAMRLLIKHAFQNMAWCGCMTSPWRTTRWQSECVRSVSGFKDGRFKDVLVMGLVGASSG
jgi:RimJ/RimL family protein N-acetyltransferase